MFIYEVFVLNINMVYCVLVCSKLKNYAFIENLGEIITYLAYSTLCLGTGIKPSIFTLAVMLVSSTYCLYIIYFFYLI